MTIIAALIAIASSGAPLHLNFTTSMSNFEKPEFTHKIPALYSVQLGVSQATRHNWAILLMRSNEGNDHIVFVADDEGQKKIALDRSFSVYSEPFLRGRSLSIVGVNPNTSQAALFVIDEQAATAKLVESGRYFDIVSRFDKSANKATAAGSRLFFKYTWQLDNKEKMRTGLLTFGGVREFILTEPGNDSCFIFGAQLRFLSNYMEARTGDLECKIPDVTDVNDALFAFGVLKKQLGILSVIRNRDRIDVLEVKAERNALSARWVARNLVFLPSMKQFLD